VACCIKLGHHVSDTLLKCGILIRRECLSVLRKYFQVIHRNSYEMPQITNQFCCLQKLQNLSTLFTKTLRIP